MNAAPFCELYTRNDRGYPLGGMAVDGIARSAGVLSPDAAGLRTFREEARLVDDQDAARLVPEVRDHVLPQIITHPVGVPDGGVQEALHALRPGLADRFGQLPA